MKLAHEFKKFVMRGNLVDLAIGFTVGAAFTTVAKSLVNDVIMPPIGLAVGRVDFKDLFWVLRPGSEKAPPYTTIVDAQAAGAVTLNYGMFVNNVLALLIVAIAMFMVIRAVNRIDEAMERDVDEAKEPSEPEVKKCPFCRTNIPFRASRCPQCTSHLDGEEPAPSGAA
jgi:large conductance mechanosensitive channel